MTLLEKLTLRAACVERWAFKKKYPRLERWAHQKREQYRARADQEAFSPPRAGERVIFCRHMEAGPRFIHLIATPENPIHWYRLGGPSIRGDGAEIRARWLCLCNWCSMQATNETAMQFAAYDCIWHGKSPPMKRPAPRTGAEA